MIKKILVVLILNLMFFSNANSEERNLELNKLFNQLKNNSNVSAAFEVEKKYGKFGRFILQITGRAIG